MRVEEITNFLEEYAPLRYQESYDNCGLIVGDYTAEVNSILITLDCTEEVLNEAISKECNLIIAHHPIIFNGIKKLNGSNYIERVIIKAIKYDIAIYSMHTNLDNVHNGVSARIADRLLLEDCKVLSPNSSFPDQKVGLGIIGKLKDVVSSHQFLEDIKSNMQTNLIRHTALVKKEIKYVAVCGGSGSSLLMEAKQAGADIFISSDFKYHDFFEADNDIIIADIGHYESEQFTKDLIYDLLVKKFVKFAVRLSKINTNPIKYL
mgnify:CR=1 FL=1